ncbi:MAG: NTP transferase domain-containing protein [Proteobacteria bacterium]|nr:NTP transferase domain-containing protein [Pseudomonadota bacterium]MBU1234395.1 NTP transferase domain-containing protein [Pseudomonadota bacterium]MBU1418575.1 NTP transferase domain-containing protein [Pseudomonadota bacterium]MBU1455056.1 NTP transferase domain-containing protein [Pseudomonadota bacterium]
MKAVILAGGKGRRMCAESTNMPKPLVAIGGIPIICHIIHYFQVYGIDEIVIAVGYQSKQVVAALQEYLEPIAKTVQIVKSAQSISLCSQNASLCVQLVDTGPDTRTGGRLRRIRPFLDEQPFFLAWCDGLSDLQLDRMMDFHKSHGRLATVAAVHPKSRFGIMELTGAEVTGFQEKPRMTDRWVNSGYAILEPEALNYIHSDDEQWEAEPINRLITDHQLMAWQHEGEWQCMDTVGDWEYLKKLWNSGSAFWIPELQS